MNRVRRKNNVSQGKLCCCSSSSYQYWWIVYIKCGPTRLPCTQETLSFCCFFFRGLRKSKVCGRLSYNPRSHNFELIHGLLPWEHHITIRFPISVNPSRLSVPAVYFLGGQLSENLPLQKCEYSRENWKCELYHIEHIHCPNFSVIHCCKNGRNLCENLVYSNSKIRGMQKHENTCHFGCKSSMKKPPKPFGWKRGKFYLCNKLWNVVTWCNMTCQNRDTIRPKFHTYKFFTFSDSELETRLVFPCWADCQSLHIHFHGMKLWK